MNDEFYNFEGEAAETIKRAILAFAKWAAENWTMSEDEVKTLNEPTEHPAAYSRGYNDGLASLTDAADLWTEGMTHV